MAMTVPLLGAWEGTDNLRNLRGLFIFTEETHVGLWVGADRKPFAAEEPTEAEEAAAYRTLRAAGGKYVVSGSSVIMALEYHRVPDPPDPIPTITFEFKLDGDHLVFATKSGWILDMHKVKG